MKGLQIRSNFWPVFFGIWSECREILRIPPYSIRMRENTNQNFTPHLDTFHAVDVRPNATLSKIKTTLEGLAVAMSVY